MADDRIPCVFELGDEAADAAATLQRPTRCPSPGRAAVHVRASELHHLVWSNRSTGETANSSGIWPIERSPSARILRSEDVAGDVVLPDGTAVWLDGGPIRFTEPIDGVPVVHRIALEHARWRPSDRTVERGTGGGSTGRRHASGGAARVIAPAGSGKTRVLTERARHLLTRSGVCRPSSVCLVAFNKRAQEEMSTGSPTSRVCRCARSTPLHWRSSMARAPFAAQPTHLTTITELEVRRIIGRLVEFPRKRNSDPVALWIEALSLARLGLRDPAEVEALYDGDVDGFAAMLPRYRRELAAARSVDYDEQIVRAIEILLTDTVARGPPRSAPAGCCWSTSSRT